ncbi:uncharacterized protein CELE_F14H3.4 [Caenorhabditis elegans]|uniref:Uncharacterized protein n=1 Tax=Caenorhabditis elegans TaxID=6239 RepID=O45366_CAEEL|nr:Uncharacterized protein CELE_F14H3.4 [Caenorhabditis elegans]CAB05486.2 Uncharacterized protein CELE_F14H3.4 [Caenorhabditis elegans]|eukprot:NP_507038.2 Uncharacterized protein CELE_F14H3.4 [Caenorhabditis elegans]
MSDPSKNSEKVPEEQEIRDNSEEELEDEILEELERERNPFGDGFINPQTTMTMKIQWTTANTIDECETRLKQYRTDYERVLSQRKPSIQKIQQYEAELQQLQHDRRTHEAAFQLLRRVLREDGIPKRDLFQESLQVCRRRLGEFDDNEEGINELLNAERTNFDGLQSTRKFIKKMLVTHKKTLEQLEEKEAGDVSETVMDRMIKELRKRRRDDEDDEEGPSTRRVPNAVESF